MFPLRPRHEGNVCIEVTRGQPSEWRVFPKVCSRLCGLACPAPSTGDAFLFCSLLRPPIQISRCGLSAHPRKRNSHAWEMPDTPAWGYQAFVKQELIEQACGVVRSSAGRRAKALDLRRPGLFPRIRSKPRSRHSPGFFSPWGLVVLSHLDHVPQGHPLQLGPRWRPPLW